MEDRRSAFTTPTSEPSAPPVRDHRQLPPGVLPRYLQQWVLMGIAVVMIGILALGGGPSRPRPTTTPSPTAAALDPNQQRIEEYQRRIQEQAQRLTREQAELTRAKQAAVGVTEFGRGNPTRTGDRAADMLPSALTPSTSSTMPTLQTMATSSASSPSSTSSTGAASLRQERAEREYRSLFADSVAFSREHSTRESHPQAATTVSPSQSPAPAVPSQGTAEASKTPVRAETVRSSAAPTGVDERYRLTEGTMIETVLTNRLDGTFAGPVNCLVTTAVYAPDRQHLVIPAGSRVLGEAKPVNTFGQSRLAVVFHRLLLPNGTGIDLHDFHGLNQVGDVGLRDQVDRHYAQIFGASLAVGAIAGFAQARTSVGFDATAVDVYRQGAAANVAQSSARILDRFLNILPTVTIREGHRIKVYFSNDLELPAYRDTLPTTGGLP